MTQTSFFSSALVRRIALVLIFGAALAIRLYDLTDLPLDIHPTRQLLSAIKARGLYYETEPDGVSTWKLETAIRQAKFKSEVEPVVFERLVAFTYRFTGEQLWVARLYSSLFWLAGGVFLFLLVRDLVSFEGAILSTAYYLLFPYAVIASRSFQPDPLMVMLILSFWWVFSRWAASNPSPVRAERSGSEDEAGRGEQWMAAVLAGLLGGFAIFIKLPAAFFVIGGALGLALSRFSFRELLRNLQVWVMALLGALPASAYLIYGMFIAGSFGRQFSGRFFPALLVSPLNYLQWETKASLAAGGIFIMLALLSLLLVRDQRMRIFLYGLWGAYLFYGLFFNYHVATHDYYHLPLIPIVAVSLAPLGEWSFARLTETSVRRWMRGAAYLILVYGLFSVVWDVRNQMKAVDYRPDAALWAEIGAQFDEKARIVALTQDYGSRLQYWGWRSAAVWPRVSDAEHISARGGGFPFEKAFKRYSSQRDFFLVTDLAELERQSELKERLLSSYPVYAEGNGYLIFDLQSPSQ
ncbi:MAG TPA: glycosyltransferase family 39 protein [Anaerolineales bacterium]|nr:glycosyltransferase family 39 protein [Anaerolineales bacterium]